MDFVAGCIGGCAGVLVGHPFDTVKVRLQTQDLRNPVYRGTFHCLSKIVKTESVSGLFRGMSSPMLGVSVVNAIVFGVYGNTVRQFSDAESLKTHFFAGLLAGSVQSAVTGPLELVKTRLQLQRETTAVELSNRTKYSGPIDCVRKIIVNEGGLRALTKGLAATVLRDGPAFATYFASYEYFTRSSLLLKSDGNQQNANSNTSAILMAGGLAGVTSWIVSYPIDVIKSRIQSSTQPETALDTARRVYAQEGYRGFFRGLNSALIRAYPTNAAVFFTVNFVYELHSSYVNGKSALYDVEERLVDTVHNGMNLHLDYHHLGEQIHLHTISNHYTH